MKKIVFIPNKGARLGHQFVEWLRGFIFCRNNDHSFYHHSFLANSEGMDSILNLSWGENLFKDYTGKLINRDQMSFNEYLASDNDDLYVYDFFLPNDFVDLGEISEEIRDILRRKYFLNNEKYAKDSIAVHIRRDDVLKDSGNWVNRYITIEYFIDVLEKLYKSYPLFGVEIFSNNVDETFYKVKDGVYKNISFHVNESIEITLNHMINSRILVTSCSGISFIASIISDNDNIKICPTNFWHKWPNECIINDGKL